MTEDDMPEEEVKEEAAEEQAKEAPDTEGKKVKVYSTPTCPWCHKLKEFLQENNIEFEDINVAEDQEAAKSMVDKTGQMGVPVSEIDGEFIIGFDEPKLKEKLNLS
jgi:glutaredoxin-like YruB-family protein